MERAIHEVAALSGVTSRTLRHYDSIGLLTPARIGNNGYRYYTEPELVRLQRILLLRELGLGLPAIAEVLRGDASDVEALGQHIRWLHSERERINEQISSVTSTINALQKGEPIMAETMFDGFDYTHYQHEVAERWGKDVAARSAEWWNALGKQGQAGFMKQHELLQDDYDAAIAANEAPASGRVQEIAQRHYDWIVSGWHGRRPSAEELIGLATMYVDDERFAKNYTRAHANGADFVRAALTHYAGEKLT